MLLTAVESGLTATNAAQSLVLMKQVQSEFEMAALLEGSILARALVMWGTAFSNLVEDVLLDGIVGDGITEAVQRTTNVRESRLGPPCRRCGEAVVDLVLESLTGGSRWAFQECPVCGPKSLSRDNGLEVQLSLPRNFTAGRRATFEIFAPSPPGHLVVDVREKANGRTLLRERRLIEEPQVTVALNLPDDLTFDQYSTRAIWIAGVEIAYARSMFFLTPHGVH